MDRACHTGAARSALRRRPGKRRDRRSRGRPLTRTLVLLAVLAGAACKVSTNLDQVIALDIGIPNGGQLEFGDTLVPTARALNGRGDSVAADIIWVSLDTAVLTVLDSTTGETR